MLQGIDNLVGHRGSYCKTPLSHAQMKQCICACSGTGSDCFPNFWKRLLQWCGAFCESHPNAATPQHTCMDNAITIVCSRRLRGALLSISVQPNVVACLGIRSSLVLAGLGNNCMKFTRVRTGTAGMRRQSMLWGTDRSMEHCEHSVQ